MKIKAMILTCMLLMSGLFIGAGAQAQPYTGTIVFTDWTDNVQNYFEPYENVYYDVTVLDGGVPLQSETVNLAIVRESDSQVVRNTTYTTNSFGQFSDSYYVTTTGLYTVYVNYSGNPVASGTFRVYDPVAWTATGWTAYYDEVTDSFTEDQRVVVHVSVVDQYGNPFDGGMGDVSYRITKDLATLANQNLNTDQNGEAMNYFYTSSQGGNQFGSYTVTVYNDAAPPLAIGSFYFTVYLPERAVVQAQNWGENRNIFKAGEWVGYSIELYYQDTLPYDSEDHAARVLLIQASAEFPLQNNTLDTESDGTAAVNWFHYIDFSDGAKGHYSICVYNRTWSLIGSADFLVVDLEISMTPDKDVYAQGDRVTIGVTTTLTDPYQVMIKDMSDHTLTGASWNVPAGTTQWSREYTFPNVQDGTYQIEIHTGAMFLESRQFELKKFTIQAMLSQESYLPGQSGMFFWRAVNNHDGTPYTITGDVVLRYTDTTFGEWQGDVMGDISGSSGSQNFRVPKVAQIGMGAYIEIDARDTSGHTDTTSAWMSVGSLAVGADKDRSVYRPGDDVFLTFTSYVAGSSISFVPGVEIKMKVQLNGVDMGSTQTLTTDAFGTVDATYSIPSSAAAGTWVIIINATFLVNDNVKVDMTSSFAVSTDSIMVMMLYQEKDFYSPGDTVTVPYKVFKDGSEISDAQVSYVAAIGSNTLAFGFGSSGRIQFTLPSGVEGYMSIQATATASDGFQASATLWGIQVSRGQLVLFAEKSFYLPGDNVTWYYSLLGDTESQAHYRITDENGVLLAEGAPSEGMFHYQLAVDQAADVTATLYVTGSEKTYTSSATAWLYNGFILEWEIAKNSYSPGSVMKINYKVMKIGSVPDSVNGYSLQITVMGYHTLTVRVMEDNGTVSYRLPEDMEDGKCLVSASLVGGPEDLIDAKVVIIDSTAGELAHGTFLGMNASGFLALVFAIVALILGIIGLAKWRRMAKKAGAESTADAPAEEEPAAPEEPMAPQEPAPPYEEPAPQYEEPAPQYGEPVPDDYPPPEEAVPPEQSQETPYQYPPPPQE